MPKVTAYKGSVYVVGQRRSAKEDDAPIAKFSEDVYAESKGMLLEQIKIVGLRLVNELQAWLTDNMPADYNLEQDYWYMGCSYPDLLHENYEHDTGFGGSIAKPMEILTSIVHNNYYTLGWAMRELDSTTVKSPYTNQNSFMEDLLSGDTKRVLSAGINGKNFDDLYAQIHGSSVKDVYDKNVTKARSKFYEKIAKCFAVRSS